MSSRGFLLYLGGLRGLAILLVVLFHMLPQYFSQGFLGVDIFLVISGYLLFRAYDGESAFKFWEFVRKKVVRIYPVMCCAIILACVLMAFAMYSADEAKVLTRTVRYALLGKVNGYFNKQYTDYFSDSANLNPLLHLWYLAVIVQVYMLWAVGCWVVSFLRHRFAAHQVLIRKWATFLIVLVALASLAYSHSLAIHDALASLGVPVWQQAQEVAYWNTFGRLWQVAAGGLVLVLPPCRKPVLCTMLAALGLGLLLLLGFCNAASVPSAALLTVLSVVLVLRYLPDTRLKALLEQRWLVWVGSISFSLYLVHFPLLVFYKRMMKMRPDMQGTLLLALASALLGCVMWWGVEKRRMRMVYLIILLGSTIGVSYVASFYIKEVAESIKNAPQSEGGALVYPVYQRPLEDVSEKMRENYDANLMPANSGTFSLLYGKEVKPSQEMLAVGEVSDNPEFVLLGDSNAQHLFPGLNEMCKSRHLSGIHLTTIMMPFMDRFRETPGVQGYKWDGEKSDALLTWLAHQQSIHTVVISELWSRHLPTGWHINWKGLKINATFEENVLMMELFCDKIRAMGKQIVLVTPSPLFPNFDTEIHGTGLEYARWMQRRGMKMNPNHPYHPFTLTKKYYDAHYERELALFNDWEKRDYCRVLHLDRAIFRNGNYLGMKGNTLYCRDKTHITPAASIDLMMHMGDEFEALIQQGRQRMGQ